MNKTEQWEILRQMQCFGYCNETPKTFTKKDLKDNHIVVDMGGRRDVSLHINWDSYTEDLIFKRLDGSRYNIMEVYEFDKLVFKRKVEILDENEKKYLNQVIRPFKDKVSDIRKEPINSIHNYIRIELKNGDTMSLPNFEKGTMYKNMEAGKKYTPKELGL